MKHICFILLICCPFFLRAQSPAATKNIFIITNEAQAAEVRKQLPKLPKENVAALERILECPLRVIYCHI